MFRHPPYLDVRPLQELADCHGVKLPGDGEVARRSSPEFRSRGQVTESLGESFGKPMEVSPPFVSGSMVLPTPVATS